MKKFGIKVMFSLFCALSLCGSVFAQKFVDNDYKTTTLTDESEVVYLPTLKKWSAVGVGDEKVLLVKRVSTNAGNYSEFVDEKGNVAIAFGTGFEFLYGEKLIAQDVYSLKFFSVYWDEDSKQFDKKMILEPKLQEIFPDVKIVKISDFKKNVLRVRKNPFKPLKILVLNDTPEYFYKYKFYGDNFEIYDVAGLLEINKCGTIEFKQANEVFRELRIKVRPVL